jgi:hypothetical protein
VVGKLESEAISATRSSLSSQTIIAAASSCRNIPITLRTPAPRGDRGDPQGATSQCNRMIATLSIPVVRCAC